MPWRSIPNPSQILDALRQWPREAHAEAVAVSCSMQLPAALHVDCHAGSSQHLRISISVLHLRTLQGLTTAVEGS